MKHSNSKNSSSANKLSSSNSEMTEHDQKIAAWLQHDPYLEPYRGHIAWRWQRTLQLQAELTSGGSLREFAAGHDYFGLHKTKTGWILREWAPNAEAIYLIGDHSDWQERPDCAFARISAEGVWELTLPKTVLVHGQLYRLRLSWPGGGGERIPAWTHRVVQNAETLVFNAQVWDPPQGYQWEVDKFSVQPDRVPFIYEAHVGMAQEEGRVGTYREFAERVIPRIVAGGYNTIQLMAVQEHPYYGSFGYQVSSFFAASSRFGTPEDLKYLVDTAHKHGLAVVMDIVHSHAASNEVEGIARYDGTVYQFFHDGARGHHQAWDSKCFDYGKREVVHFLLSNVRYWLEEFRFDGFRFDGVTSMLYQDHGLEKVFTGYGDYFSQNVDEDAVSYLMLATRLAHEIRPDCILIAEDVSGMPGLALEQDLGGMGFSYRYAMGVADHWIKLVKDQRDEDWNIGWLWHELVNRRVDEKTISYAESHDQSLVGDQTLAFRLMGPDIYWHMDVDHQKLSIDRGMALHKMIRLITIGAAGNGYMNFMGNEFGHPEWVDFPRQGNNWSYSHARRQWSLADNQRLRYHLLAKFDRAMVQFMQTAGLLQIPEIYLRKQHEEDKVLAFQRHGYLFVFNFHPEKSFTNYWIQADAGSYDIVLDTDDREFGGFGRVEHGLEILTLNGEDGQSYVSLYLPSRSALVLARRQAQSAAKVVEFQLREVAADTEVAPLEAAQVVGLEEQGASKSRRTAKKSDQTDSSVAAKGKSSRKQSLRRSRKC